MSNINQIWLAPICHEDGDGRLWCQDDVWGDDCGCGVAQHSAVRYVLASDYDACASRLHEVAEVCAIAEQERDTFKAECVNINNILDQIRTERDALRAQVEMMRALIDTPHTDEWFEAVRLEAAHQIKRWGTDHDAGKAPADWFWLLGYLGGKALAAAIAGNTEKAKHHTISSGAALLNWFRALTADSDEMRPGIDIALQDKP